MAELLANGSDWKDLTPDTTLAPDGTAVVKLAGAPSGHHPELRLTRADVASVLKGLSKPAPPKLEVGLIGLCGRYTGSSEAEQRAIETATGIKADRIDVRFGTTGEATTGEELALLTEYTKRGAQVLPIYDPQPETGRAPAQIEADMKLWAPTLLACGTTLVECGNEPYYNAVRPGEHAAVYKAMVAGLAGTGIHVLAKGWGDYYTGSEWSQCAGGRGWCVDFCKALGGVPWGWAEHYYGAQDAAGVLGGGAAAGWGSVKVMQAYRAEHDLTAPLWITETGQQAPSEVTEAEQAQNLNARILQAQEMGVRALYIFCAIGDGYGLWTPQLAARPAVAAVAEAVKAVQ